MKRLKRLFAVLLACVLLMPLVPSSAATVTLTAVNDTFLPLSSSTMPIRRSGDIYVPYSVFTGTLGLRAYYDAQQQTLVLQGTNTTLTFSLAQGYVYDQNMNSYSPPAYSTSGGIFVPVKLVCSQFGFSYSVISATNADVLRICNANAVLSDHVFINSAAGKIAEILDAYNNPQTGPGTSEPDSGSSGGASGEPTNPDTPTTQPETVVRPSLVYLTFAGTTNEYTAGILETLREYGRPSTFFLPVSDLGAEEFLRAIAIDHHSFGFLITADMDDPLSLLTAANTALFSATGLTSHLIMVDGGCHQLPQSTRDSLINAGYRFWDATLTASDNNRSASRASSEILAAFAATTTPSVLCLHHAAATAQTLSSVLSDMTAHQVASLNITLSDPPINLVGESR